MRNHLTLRLIMLAVFPIVMMGVLGETGCPAPTPVTPAPAPPTITGAGVSGALVAGQSSTVRVEATVTGGNTIAAVSADLMRIGGSQAQPLTLTTSNLWAFQGTLIPPNAGQQSVPVLATDTTGATGQATATVMVASTQPSVTGPQIRNATATGTLTRNAGGAITVSATVLPTTAAIAKVIADLTPVGGLSDAPLALTTANVWSFSGVVFPTLGGVQTITIEATDNLGNTSTATTTITIGDLTP